MKTPHPGRRASRLAVLAATTLATVAAVVASGAASAAPAPAGGTPRQVAPAPPAGFTTVFTDDFNGAAGTGVGRGRWLYDLGHGYPGGAGNWGTGEIEEMTDSTANVAQDGAGNLAI